MFTKRTLRSASWVSGLVFVVSIFIGVSGGLAMAQDASGGWDQCGDSEDFTTVFRLEDCKFKTTGENPYFILRPDYRVVLETPEGEDEREKSVETVLRETKRINLDGRRIRTRVLEERAFEWDEEEGEWKAIEISLNYFAICKKTNAVYYFGEWSRDCEEGFDEDDFCEEGESTAGSWEAGVDGAMPGLMMPGTPLLGAKYFQEVALSDDAMDRGEIVGLGLVWPEGAADPEFEDCIKIEDTNPIVGECDDDDEKIYCPGIGLVQDQELELVSNGYVNDDDDDDDDDD